MFSGLGVSWLQVMRSLAIIGILATSTISLPKQAYAHGANGNSSVVVSDTTPDPGQVINVRFNYSIFHVGHTATAGWRIYFNGVQLLASGTHFHADGGNRVFSVNTNITVPNGSGSNFIQIISYANAFSGASRSTTIPVNLGNSAPTAVAAITPNPVEAGTNVNISGSASSDPDSDTLSYSWVQTGGPDLGDGTVTSATWSKTTPAFRTDGQNTYTYRLIVNDGTVDSSPSFASFVVQDTTPPVISGMPGSITQDTDPGASTAVVTWTPPSAADFSGLASLVSSHNPGNTFPIGTTTVTYTAIDIAGNSSFQTFDITIEDNEAPVITPPPDTSDVTDPGLATKTLSFSATVSDNVDSSTSFTPVFSIGGNTITFPHAFPIGATTVTVEANADAAGNDPDPVTFVVTIEDQEKPAITPPSDITVGNDPGVATANVTFTGPNAATITDNDGIAAFEYLPMSGHEFPLGTTTVTINAEDHSGNTASATFTVTVNDTEQPVISPPANIITGTDPGLNTAIIDFSLLGEATATDNDQVASISYSPASGSAFPIGITTVTATATDPAGNSSQTTFSVTVSDNEAPQVTVPSDMTVSTDAGSNTAIVNFTEAFEASAGDNDGVASLTYSPPSGSAFPIGTTTITVTATDNSGNATSDTFTVTVEDNEPPALTPPADIITVTDAGLDTAIVTFIAAAIDNDGIASLDYSPASGSAFPIGVTTVTVTATDNTGNSTTDTFTVTVSDTENPVIVGLPTDIVQSTDKGKPSAVVSWPTVTASDNAPGVSISSTHASGDIFPLGMTTVTYTATDAAGNSVSGSFTVTVNDTEAPIINVPAPVTVSTDPGVDTAVVNFSASATDNDGVASLTYSPLPGSAFPIGTSTITITATDNTGNETTETFTITVTDDEAPVFTSFPENIVIEVDYPSTSSTASWKEPAGTDNAPGMVINRIAGPASGASFSEGTTTVTYEAVDAAGNRVEQSFTVTVNQIPPGTVTLVVDSPADGTFSFSSPEAVLNTSITAHGGGGVSKPISIRPGNYPVSFTPPPGVGIASTTCTAGGSTIDPTSKSGNIVLASRSSVVCTIVALNSVEETVGQIGSFLEARSQLVLQHQPSLNRRLDRLNGRNRTGEISGFGLSFSNQNLPLSATFAEEAASFSWSLRNARAAKERQYAANDVVTVATRMKARPGSGADNSGGALDATISATEQALTGQTGAFALVDQNADRLADNNVANDPALAAPFDIWIEGQYTRFEHGAGDGHFGIAHIGMDYLFTSDFLAGISAQFDWTSIETTGSGEVTGHGFMVGPYLTARLADDLYLDARAGWGRASNEISPFGTYTDDFDTERMLVTAALIGETSWQNIRIRPEARFSWYREESEAYTDTLNVRIPSVTVETGTFEFGPTFSTREELDDGHVLEPFLTVEGIWTFVQDNTATTISDQPGIGDTGLRGKVETGFNVAGPSGQSVSASVSYDGIGDGDYAAWTGKLYFSTRF